MLNYETVQASQRLRLFELSFLLVRFDHIASIVNANHSIM